MKTIVITATLALTLGMSAMAQDSNIQTLSEGACWYEQGEFLKVASFNDRESVFMSREDIEYQVDELLHAKKKSKAFTTELALHCGGYGSSLVVKTVIDDRPACAWMKFNKGKLVMRSVGGLEETEGELCDGYKWGELILAVKTIEQKHLLESIHFTSMVKSVSVISGLTLKVTLTPQYFGKEIEVMKELKTKVELRYIELNHYQHPVGESVPVK